MLPIEFIREHPEAVRRAMREKSITADLDGLLAVDSAPPDTSTRAS